MTPSGQPSVGAPLHRRDGMFLAAPLAAGVLILLLVALVVSGHSPVSHSLVQFTPKGLIAAAPSAVTRIELRTGQESVALRRNSSGWTIEGAAGAVPAELASHIDAGLRFMHVSEPMREIAASELTVANFAEFGLDPPASVLVLGTAGGTVATVNFGVLNPAGTSQYVRLAGAPTVYLMARHVGTEWQVAGDMARRLRGRAEPAIANRRHESAVAGVARAGLGGGNRVRGQGHALRARRRRQMVPAHRPALSCWQHQRPCRRSGTGPRDRRARSTLSTRSRSKRASRIVPMRQS